MNKKLLIALGMLIVLIVGLVSINSIDYHRIVGERIAKQMEEQLMENSVVTAGENTVKLYSTSATYLGYYNGRYNVRFKGSIAVWSNEPMPWRAGFNVSGSRKIITICEPGRVRTFTYTRGVYCARAYWWRVYGVRLDGVGAEGPTKSWSVYDIPCQ